jgi:hypothetical protein
MFVKESHILSDKQFKNLSDVQKSDCFVEFGFDSEFDWTKSGTVWPSEMMQRWSLR